MQSDRHAATIDANGYARCECRTPLFQVIGNVLVILARHHGEQHEVMISLDDIQRYLESRKNN